MQSIIFTIPAGLWLSANGRYHWAVRADRTRRLRALAGWQARHEHLEYMDGPACLVVHVRARGRFDPPNSAPTVKALIDGLVDADVLADDSSKQVPETIFRRMPGVPPVGCHVIRIDMSPDRGELTEERHDATD